MQDLLLSPHATCMHSGLEFKFHYRWSTRGNLFLSNMRLVFVAVHADASGAHEGCCTEGLLPCFGVSAEPYMCMSVLT